MLHSCFNSGWMWCNLSRYCYCCCQYIQSAVQPVYFYHQSAITDWNPYSNSIWTQYSNSIPIDSWNYIESVDHKPKHLDNRTLDYNRDLWRWQHWSSGVDRCINLNKGQLVRIIGSMWGWKDCNPEYSWTNCNWIEFSDHHIRGRKEWAQCYHFWFRGRQQWSYVLSWVKVYRDYQPLFSDWCIEYRVGFPIRLDHSAWRWEAITSHPDWCVWSRHCHLSITDQHIGDNWD